MRRVRVGLSQVNPTVGAVEANARLVIAGMERARALGCDIVAFPELVLTGYPPEDLLFKPAFIEANLRALAEVARASRGLTAIVGYVDKRDDIFNAAAILHDGVVAGTYHKQYLPNYGVFDENRYFQSGTESPVFTIGDTVIAANICEDIWYPTGPTTLQALGGAELVVSINASPYHAGKGRFREKMLATRAAEAPPRRVTLPPLPAPERPRLPAHEVAVLEPVEEIYQALVLGARDYVTKNGFRHVVLGLSGGIDSSLVAAIACDALGPANVTGVTMSSQFSSKGTRADAARLARNLGIEFLRLPITPVLNAYRRALAKPFKGLKEDVTEENLQARIRGNYLMALSNKFGWLVLTTGNKSEIGVGYSTLYGDMAGGFAVIKDVPKTLVYQVSEHVNRRAGREVIPRSVFERAPSAELRPDQTDQDTLPAYATLDAILEAYVEGDQGVADIVARGFDAPTVKRVIAMVDRNEYKRRQWPIGIKITPRAFGKDWRLPIVNRFRE